MGRHASWACGQDGLGPMGYFTPSGAGRAAASRLDAITGWKVGRSAGRSAAPHWAGVPNPHKDARSGCAYQGQSGAVIARGRGRAEGTGGIQDGGAEFPGSAGGSILKELFDASQAEFFAS